MARTKVVNTELTCRCCGRTFTHNRGLGNHIATSLGHPTLREYFVAFIDPSAGVCQCGEPTQFVSLVCGFRRFCGRACSCRSLFAGKERSGPRLRKPKGSRECEKCKARYQPDNGRQRWCLDCGPSPLARSRLHRYNLSDGEFKALLLKQNFKCALCENDAVFVDHCHATGIVRGILCPGCNTALNRVEIIGWTDRAHKYLEQNENLPL